MRLAGEVLQDGSDTSAFVGDAISNAVANPNPLLNEDDPRLPRTKGLNERLDQRDLDIPTSSGMHGVNTTLHFPGT